MAEVFKKILNIGTDSTSWLLHVAIIWVVAFISISLIPILFHNTLNRFIAACCMAILYIMITQYGKHVKNAKSKICKAVC